MTKMLTRRDLVRGATGATLPETDPVKERGVPQPAQSPWMFFGYGDEPYFPDLAFGQRDQIVHRMKYEIARAEQGRSTRGGRSLQDILDLFQSILDRWDAHQRARAESLWATGAALQTSFHAG